MKKIENNSRISLFFKMQLEDGTEVESNFDEAAIEFEIGNGSLTMGMEDALIDKSIGDTVCVTLTADQAFGQPNQDNIHAMPVEDFPEDLPPEVNQVIAFDGPDDTEIMGTILSVSKNEVEVDFSHPLAGRSIIFTAKVQDIF